MATEAQECLEKYNRGLDALRKYDSDRKCAEELKNIQLKKEGVDKLIRFYNDERLVCLIDDIDTGLKYKDEHPEMSKGITELLDFLKCDNKYVLTEAIARAVERIHNSLKLGDKEDKKLAKQYKLLLKNMAKSLGKTLDDFIEKS